MQNVVVEVPSEGGDEEDSVLASLKRHNEEVLVDEESEYKQVSVLPPVDVTKVSAVSASNADIDDNQEPKHITSGQRPSSNTAPKTQEIIVMDKETIDYANSQPPDLTPLD